MFSSENFLENAFKDFYEKGFNFNYIAEMNIITKANKLDMAYDFYINHNMHMVERKLNELNIKTKN